MNVWPVRLHPGDDLRGALEALVGPGSTTAYFVVAGIGSLIDARLRLAGAAAATVLPGDHEITSLAGTVTAQGAHLHAVLSDASGAVVGGHVVPGNRVRTTAEILLVPLTGWRLTRSLDPQTGYAELQITPAPTRPGGASA